jgi:riboflavin kinase/FMN adenylyltransferase
MEVVKGLEALPLRSGPVVTTVGFFDGVHLGHRAVFDRVGHAAAERGARSAVVTFDRHPREVLSPGNEPRLLTSLERKRELIAEAGIDTLVVLNFDRDFSLITAEEFVRDVLVAGLGAVHACMGANFTFGFRAAGNMQNLPEMAEPLGLTVESVETYRLDGRIVSSTSIRQALGAGDLEWPTLALGRRFVLDGEVVTGHGRGKGMGFPTANLRTRPRLLLPGSGIYAGVATHRDRRYAAAIDVGTNPTFGVEPLHVEAFLLSYEGSELPGEPLSIEFWKRLRDEERYEGVPELAAAIASDVEKTREVIPPHGLG